MSKKFTYVLFTLPLLAISSLSLFAQNTALSFSRAAGDFATTSAFPIPNTGLATIELWAYVPAAEPGVKYFISQGTDGTGFGIGYNGSNTHIQMGDLYPDANANLPMGQWNHIAVAYDGNIDSAWLYLNGKAVDSVQNYFIPNSGSHLQLGTDVNDTSFFTGKLDQVRIWNTKRTPAQIKGDMYGPVSPSDPTLTAEWLFDASPGVTMNSSSTSGLDLTLTGTTTVSSPVMPGNNALVFDGAATQVSAPGNPALDLTTGTIEAWVRPAAATGTGTIIAVRDPSNSRFSVHLNNIDPSPANHYLTLYNSVTGASAVFYPPGFTNGTWYHVAFVTAPNGGADTTGIYVNGAYVGMEPVGYGRTVPSSLPVTIGANGAGGEFFTGGLDEIRIWNTPLSQTQIQSAMAGTLDGGQPGLVSLYSFDQGIADGNNTGLKVVVDNAPLTNNATMNNSFALNGVGTNFTSHTLTPLPLTLTKFSVSKQGNGALLQWETSMEENTSGFIIERSGNGTTFTDIGSIPAAGNSHLKLDYSFTDDAPIEGKNYYRLRETDLDNKFTYSPVRLLAFTIASKLIWYSTGSKAVEVRLQNGNNELYSIMDIGGHIIRAGRLSSGVTGLSGLPAGIYFVKVVTNAGNELNTKVLLK